MDAMATAKVMASWRPEPDSSASGLWPSMPPFWRPWGVPPRGATLTPANLSTRKPLPGRIHLVVLATEKPDVAQNRQRDANMFVFTEIGVFNDTYCPPSFDNSGHTSPPPPGLPVAAKRAQAPLMVVASFCCAGVKAIPPLDSTGPSKTLGKLTGVEQRTEVDPRRIVMRVVPVVPYCPHPMGPSVRPRARHRPDAIRTRAVALNSMGVGPIWIRSRPALSQISNFTTPRTLTPAARSS